MTAQNVFFGIFAFIMVVSAILPYLYFRRRGWL